MASKRQTLKNLKTGRQTPATKGKQPRVGVWGKLLVCSCGEKFNNLLHYVKRKFGLK